MKQRALLLINRGARRGTEARDEVGGCLRALGLDVIEESAENVEEVSARIRRHRADVTSVIVAGGDGTLSAAVPGLMEAGLPLGIVPLGTANNLARTLGIPSEPGAACEVIARGSRRRVDAARVNDQYFFNTASLGMSVDIAESLTADTKRRWGVLAYGVTALRTVWRTKPFQVEVSWAGGSMTTRSVQIVVGNGRHYGSALTVCEDAEIDDGTLDLYSIETRGWWRLLALLPALKRGRHIERGDVRSVNARRLELRTDRPLHINVDGEISTSTPAVFEVLPGAIEVFAPPSAPPSPPQAPSA